MNKVCYLPLYDSDFINVSNIQNRYFHNKKLADDFRFSGNILNEYIIKDVENKEFKLCGIVLSMLHNYHIFIELRIKSLLELIEVDYLDQTIFQRKYLHSLFELFDFMKENYEKKFFNTYDDCFNEYFKDLHYRIEHIYSYYDENDNTVKRLNDKIGNYIYNLDGSKMNSDKCLINIYGIREIVDAIYVDFDEIDFNATITNQHLICFNSTE